MGKKRVILIDLDGVLNEYKGDFFKEYIPPVKQGAKEFLEHLASHFNIKLFTTRNRILVSKWLIANNLDHIVEDVTNVKEISWLYIDDRCLKFEGDYSKTLDEIRTFKSWYKIN